MEKPKEPRLPDYGKLDFIDHTKLGHRYEKGEEIVIYSDSCRLLPDEEYEDEWCEECENEGCEECETNSDETNDHTSITSMSLQDLIDKIPEGLTPKDIKIDFDVNISQMGISYSDCAWINFFYYKPVDLEAELKRYEKEKLRFKKEKAEYKKRLKEWKEYQREQDIKMHEAAIRTLKERKVKIE
jgi:hypothetical protein